MTRPWRTKDHRPGGAVARLALTASLIAAAGLGLSSSTSPPPGMILVGYGSSGFHAAAAPGAGQSGPGAALAPVVSVFSVSGSVGSLYPGNTRSLVFTVTNPLKVTITVTSISTTVSNASTSCVAANLKVASFAGHLVVLAGKTAHATVNATLVHSAPNGCQGAHFPLHYTALATEA